MPTLDKKPMHPAAVIALLAAPSSWSEGSAEAGASGAGAAGVGSVGAKLIKVPQRKDFSHDVEAMCAADPNAGMIYICNPNNPTGSFLPCAELARLHAALAPDVLAALTPPPEQTKPLRAKKPL